MRISSVALRKTSSNSLNRRTSSDLAPLEESKPSLLSKRRSSSSPAAVTVALRTKRVKSDAEARAQLSASLEKS
jgi:hypothetical protein